MIRKVFVSLFIVCFAVALSACGDTWRGAKKDTGENMEKTGAAIENAGEKIKK
jgi:predicted small secreted protein